MAAEQAPTTLLVIIDPQIDFHPGGSLAVAGADQDAQNLAVFIKRMGAGVTDIVVTMDTHQKYHVGHPLYWKNADGAHPGAFTAISSQQIANGEFVASDPENQESALAYVQALEATGKFGLFIWPFHCIAGTPGHNIDPTIMEALNEWADVSKKPIDFIFKGTNAHTEMYSALKAEVPNEDGTTALNERAIAKWQTYGRVLFCGQAQSHCVNFTARDFIANSPDSQPAKTILLTDCQSSVGGFEEQGVTFFSDMEKLGVQLMASTDL